MSCGVAKLAGVKVNVAPLEIVRSLSPLTRSAVTVTLLVGACARRTETTDEPPSCTLNAVG